jgi:glyoxylase-like metal-dependent hydrolase (beta-lactamase superfamily II)
MEAFERVALPSECAPLQAAYVLPHSQGEILLVDLPGHAAGHMGALVACDDGWHLLAADAAWSRANYRDWKLPSPLSYLIMDKSSAFKHTLGQLQQLDALGKVSIHLSHEEG